MKKFNANQTISDLKTEISCKNATIKELTALLAEKDAIIERYKSSLEAANVDLTEYKKYLTNTPEDCKPGAYCRSCHFSEEFSVRLFNPTGSSRIEYMPVCIKGGICSNFVKKGGC